MIALLQSHVPEAQSQGHDRAPGCDHQKWAEGKPWSGCEMASVDAFSIEARTTDNGAIPDFRRLHRIITVKSALAQRLTLSRFSGWCPAILGYKGS